MDDLPAIEMTDYSKWALKCLAREIDEKTEIGGLRISKLSNGCCHALRGMSVYNRMSEKHREYPLPKDCIKNLLHWVRVRRFVVEPALMKELKRRLKEMTP